MDAKVGSVANPLLQVQDFWLWECCECSASVFPPLQQKKKIVFILFSRWTYKKLATQQMSEKIKLCLKMQNQNELLIRVPQKRPGHVHIIVFFKKNKTNIKQKRRQQKLFKKQLRTWSQYRGFFDELPLTLLLLYYAWLWSDYGRPEEEQGNLSNKQELKLYRGNPLLPGCHGNLLDTEKVREDGCTFFNPDDIYK